MAGDDGWLTIANEFTTVRVRRERTRNGERLAIESPALGFAVRLDALELESLTWQRPERFSQLLESPYGPEPETDARALSELLE